ncbi:MAG TPA: hemerythrin domain-containing protein [Mycobacterium sp.]|nr:hemerythrin domain-containing protein [Mycobacterium sp.]
MNAYTVLQDHHKVLRGLVKKISSAPAASPERQEYLDELLVELDIHFRIEDDLYYPALSAASTLVAIAHAEHRQVIDQLAVLLRTPPGAPGYEDEWRSFATVLEAHADEEERDMIPAPPPVQLSDEELDTLGDQMASRIKELRDSTAHKLHVRGRKALMRAM